MAFVEDTTDLPSPLEQKLIDGVSFTRLNRLLIPLRRNVLTEQRPDASAQRIVQLAASLEPGALFDTYFPKEYLASRFRTKKRLLEVDKRLQPYYGLVNGAMGELRLDGLDPVVTDMWLHYFRQDNGHYRTQVVASMCVVGALSDLGFSVEV